MEYIEQHPGLIDHKLYPHLSGVTRWWITKDLKYDIKFDKINGFKHLRIKRIDNKPIRNYKDMQKIKNDLLGEGVTAIEVFPAVLDEIDNSNTYHLWASDKFRNLPNLKTLYYYK